MTTVRSFDVTDQEQVDELWGLQGRDHDLEEELAQAHIARVSAFQGGGLHASDVFEVILETGRVAYFKPANGLNNPVGARALRNYGHRPLSPVICECAAWQLAKRLGRPWSEMVAPTAVLREAVAEGFYELPRFVVPERINALEGRARRMLETGRMLRIGEF